MIGATLRMAVYGYKIGSYRGGKEHVDLFMRLRDQDRDSPDDLEALKVTTGLPSMGQPLLGPDGVTLGDVKILLPAKEVEMPEALKKIGMNTHSITSMALYAPQDRKELLFRLCRTAMKRLGLVRGDAKPFTAPARGTGPDSVGLQDAKKWLEGIGETRLHRRDRKLLVRLYVTLRGRVRRSVRREKT